MLRRARARLLFALGSLARRGARNLALVVALALCTGALVSTLTLASALREQARAGLATMPELTVSRLRAGRPALVSTAALAQLRALPGVASARGRVWGYLYLEGLDANTVVVGTELAQSPLPMGALVQGRAPAPDARGWVLPGAGIVRALGLLQGDLLGLRAPDEGAPVDLTVTGTFRSATRVHTADVLLMDARDARALLGMRDDEAADLALELTNPDEGPVLARRIQTLLPGARVAERRTLARAYELTFGTRGGLVLLGLLPALLAVLLMAWERATGLSAQERREVGVLKAVGWSARDVVSVRMLEALLLSMASTLLGLLGAYAYVFVAGAPLAMRALVGWSPMGSQLELVPPADAAVWLTGVALVAVPYLASATLPAWRAATLDPAEVLREG